MVKKKILLVISILMCIFIFASCSNNINTNTSTNSASKNNTDLSQFVSKEKILSKIPKNVEITINNKTYNIDVSNAEEDIKNIAVKNGLKYFNYINESDIKNIKDKDYLLVFSKEECPACKYYKTVLFTFIQSNKIPVYIVDIDKNSDVINKFNIVKTPTTLIYKDGQEVNRIEGFMDLTKLKTLLGM